MNYFRKEARLFVIYTLVAVGFNSLLDARQLIRARPSGVAFANQTYRIYVSKEREQAWIDGYDEIAEQGFAMTRILTGDLDSPVSLLDTPFGPLGLDAEPLLLKQDFHIRYAIPTYWPYCQSLSRCIVYSQQENTDPSTPLKLKLPDGVGAVDFYLDAAIDCITTLSVTLSCTLTVQPGNVSKTQTLNSICDSPLVGTYFGVYDASGGNVSDLSVTCESAYPRAVALLRLGSLDVYKDGSSADGSAPLQLTRRS